MAKWKTIELNRQGGNRSLPTSQNYIRVSIINDKQKMAAKNGKVVAVSIGGEVCQKLRWMIGDRVKLQLSEDGLWGLMRSTNGGNLLTPQGVATKLHLGECMKCRVTFAVPTDIVNKLFPDKSNTSRVVDDPLIDLDHGVLVITG